jgi:hypothetical protein
LFIPSSLFNFSLTKSLEFLYPMVTGENRVESKQRERERGKERKRLME